VESAGLASEMKKDVTIPDRLFTEHGKEIEEIFRRAVRKALWRHKRLGQSIAVWQDGQVVIVPPEQIQIEDEEMSSANELAQ
jgi:hypothetical protein